MTHLETIDALADRFAGRLSPEQIARMDHHLAECATCRSAVSLLERTLEPGPRPPFLAADPYLPTRIREMAAHRPGRDRLIPVLRWSFASIAIGAALVLGVLLGSTLPRTDRTSSATSDLVSEFATSLSASDLGDQWYSAVETEGGLQP